MKIAVVTGGGHGIGRALCRRLAADGLTVVVADIDKDAAKTVSDEIGGHAYPLDVSDGTAFEAMIDYVEANIGPIDLFVSNAGTGSNETVAEAADEKWQYYWDLHVMAAVRLSRGLVPLMQARGGGVIINNASICAKQPLDYEPIYNVTKAALMMFSKNLSEEVIGDHIRVNCINPGPSKTALHIRAYPASKKNDSLPVPEQYKAMFLYLMSNDLQQTGYCFIP